MILPCDFCDSKTAVLFCRADSAKLCLLCDQHVHAANALSLKHVRYQICDTCKSDTASVRCSTHNLVLCHHCDSHAHSSASPHHRHHLHGLSGCPSVPEIASALGLDFTPDHPPPDPECLLVPTAAATAKYNRDDVYQQVLEIARRSDLGAHSAQLKFDNDNNNQNDAVDEMLLQTPFQSLLMLPLPSESEFDATKSNGNCYGTETGDLLWNCCPTYQTPQVWDFQLQKSTDCGEPRVLAFDGLDEASLPIPRAFQDLHNMNCTTIGDDILSRNA